MIKTFNYEDIRKLVLWQGISPKANIWPTAHFCKTMHYSMGDLHELARLIREQHGIRLTVSQINDLTTIKDTVEMLNQLRPSSDGTLRRYLGEPQHLKVINKAPGKAGVRSRRKENIAA